ncbi:MAG: thiamine pyrophosphate-binding protein [Chloroflexi bacterium]|nr:thiamine pyrophosphate-binding protein [Chloroflexota bacterium]
MGSTVHGGKLVAKALKAEGVQYLFTLNGGHIAPIFDGCIDEGIKLLDVRHEQSAVHMADGWARATGRPGVCALTAGPGVTDGITGIANAYHSASPLIILGGAHPLNKHQMGPLQEMDHVSMVRPIVKWIGTCYDTQRIPEYISIAFRHATTGRPGPVYLELPEDILGKKVDDALAPLATQYRTAARPHGDPAMVRQAVELLMAAERPVVIAGSGVWWSGAGKELQQLIEAAELPLALTEMGRGAVPEDHPLCFGPNRVGVRQADVILVMATRLNYQLGYGRPPMFPENVKVIQVDIEPSEIGRNRPVEVGIVGDAKAILGQMNDEIRRRQLTPKHTGWVEECQAYIQKRRQDMEADATSDQTPIHPLRLCTEINNFLPPKATMVADGGEISIWGALAKKMKLPGRWMDNGPFGALGPGFGFTLAAKLARPDEPALLLSGDGTFGLNGMEVDTAVRHNIPFVVVVGNDGGWGMSRHGHWMDYGRERGEQLAVRLGVRPYHKMVEGLGGYGELVERPEDIRPALERAFASGRPACVNVAMDQEAMPGGRQRRRQHPGPA